MSELKMILENFRIKEELIKINNEIPLFLPINCVCESDIKEQQMRLKEMIERKSKELQQLQKEKTEAIKEYYKRQNEKMSNMTDRQLLEEIYIELERSNNAAKNIHAKRESR